VCVFVCVCVHCVCILWGSYLRFWSKIAIWVRGEGGWDYLRKFAIFESGGGGYFRKLCSHLWRVIFDPLRFLRGMCYSGGS